MDLPRLLPGLDQDTSAMRIAKWCEAVDASERFLLAGLRRKIGPEGDRKAAYREWYENHRREHDRILNHLVEEFNRLSNSQGSGISSQNPLPD
jgi:hypothetical protein